uniref:Uncharacterized protein n=1 Tax=Rhizophora mucronata TaxID=61149 RepID=A0A2P2QUA6_RHIMU
MFHSLETLENERLQLIRLVLVLENVNKVLIFENHNINNQQVQSYDPLLSSVFSAAKQRLRNCAKALIEGNQV